MKKSIILLVSALLSLGAMQAANPVYEKCPGESQELKTTKTGDSYQWYKNGSPISGATNNKYTVTNIQEEATYKCEVKTKGATRETGNLITLGGFEFPCNNPKTSATNRLGSNVWYQYLNFDQGGKDIAIGATTTHTNANNVKKQYFCKLKPNTGSYLYVCDGANSSSARVWQAGGIKLPKGKYQFSCHVANIDSAYASHGTNSLAKLKFVIKNDDGEKELLSFTAPSALGTWEERKATFTAEKDYGWCDIYIINFTTEPEGNDFALDDIYFGTEIKDDDTTEEESFNIKLKDCKGTESITHPEQTNCPEQEVTLTCDTDITGAISVTWEHDSSNKTKTATVKTGATVGDSKPYKCTIIKTENSKTITYTETFKVTTIDCSSRDSIIHNLEGCPGQEVQLVCDKTGASITWAHDESIKTNSTTVKTNLTTDKVDKYTCTIVNTINGETTTYIEVFYVKTKVCTDTNSEHEKVLVGSDITIMSQYSGVSGATYQWYKIEEDGTRTPVGNEESLTFQADKNAKYECITVLPTGVTVTETREVEIYTAPTLEPDIFFTPNNDGLNDLWKIKGIENAPNAHIMIYDRNSKLLYKSVGSDFKGWDGNYNGHGMVQDDYWYVILVPENDDTISGHFILKR